MSSVKKQKWDILLEKLSINTEHSKVASHKNIVSLAEKINVNLPEDYQYYCQILGSGCLAEFIDIYYLDEDLILEGKEVAEYMIERINYGIQHRTSIDSVSLEAEEYNENRDDESYILLLNSSLVFGNYNGEIVFFWDLRTYNSSDDSYDIYCYSQDVPDGEIPVKIGRDFTDFICDFCYGQLPCQLISEVFPESPREVSYTFYGG